MPPGLISFCGQGNWEAVAVEPEILSLQLLRHLRLQVHCGRAHKHYNNKHNRCAHTTSAPLPTFLITLPLWQGSLQFMGFQARWQNLSLRCPGSNTSDSGRRKVPVAPEAQETITGARSHTSN